MAKKTMMLFIPINKEIPEINAILGLRMTSQAMKLRITRISKKGKARPRIEINHQFCGFR
jgi:hypothetical protein